MPFITHTTKKITSIKGSYGCPRWFDAVYNSDLEYIKKHSKNINKVTLSLMRLGHVSYDGVYRETNSVTEPSITPP